MNDKTIKTKKNEHRIKTIDPKELLNKFLVENLCRTWKEEFLDKETNETVYIDRGEIILEKGVCLNAGNMQIVNFHIQTGDITEPIEVSDQSRQGKEAEYRIYPYSCSVLIDGTMKEKYLLEARGIPQVLDIVRDYCELNYSGSFSFKEVKTYDSAVILVDRLRKLPTDEAQRRYIQGEIEFEEFIDDVVDDIELEAHKADEDEDHTDNCKFYQIKAAIYRNGTREPETELFVVLAADADRAIMTINAWLQAQQRRYNEKIINQRSINGQTASKSELDNDTITATIEESKIVNFTKLIPHKFCMAYAEE